MNNERSAVIARLQTNVAKQAALVSELAMWAKVEDQGIDPETVKAFTFCENLLSPTDVRKHRKAIVFNNKPSPFANCYNAVQMKDGSLRKLDPMIAQP